MWRSTHDGRQSRGYHYRGHMHLRGPRGLRGYSWASTQRSGTNGHPLPSHEFGEDCAGAGASPCVGVDVKVGSYSTFLYYSHNCFRFTHTSLFGTCYFVKKEQFLTTLVYLVAPVSSWANYSSTQSKYGGFLRLQCCRTFGKIAAFATYWGLVEHDQKRLHLLNASPWNSKKESTP